MRRALLAALLGLCFCFRVGLASEEESIAASLADAGSSLLTAGKTEKAQAQFYKALAHDRHCALALYELGKMFEAEGNAISAADFLSQAVMELAKGEAANKDFTAKRIDATKRLQKLNPLAMNYTALLEEYSVEMAKIAKKCPDAITTEDVCNRMDSLQLATLLPAEKLPKVERPKKESDDPKHKFIDETSSGPTSIPPDVELALKKDGWKTISGTWKKKGEKIYEVTDGKLTSPYTSGAVETILHKGYTGSVEIMVHKKGESYTRTSPSGTTFTYYYDTGSGFGTTIKGSVCELFIPIAINTGWITPSGDSSWNSFKERQFSLPDAPKHKICVVYEETPKDGKLTITVNDKAEKRGSFVGVSKDGEFMIKVQGTAILESPRTMGK